MMDKMCPVYRRVCFLIHGANQDSLCKAFGGTDLSGRSLPMYVSAIC
jgi:hypothetical protein